MSLKTYPRIAHERIEWDYECPRCGYDQLTSEDAPCPDCDHERELNDGQLVCRSCQKPHSGDGILCSDCWAQAKELNRHGMEPIKMAAGHIMKADAILKALKYDNAEAA